MSFWHYYNSHTWFSCMYFADHIWLLYSCYSIMQLRDDSVLYTCGKWELTIRNSGLRMMTMLCLIQAWHVMYMWVCCTLMEKSFFCILLSLCTLPTTRRFTWLPNIHIPDASWWSLWLCGSKWAFVGESQELKQHYSSLHGFSYLPVTKLLEHRIVALESVNVVVQCGHKYTFVHQSTIDDLVWFNGFWIWEIIFYVKAEIYFFPSKESS